MVVDKHEEEATDRLFHALADATRRDIVRRVAKLPLSVSGLAASYAMSFAAVQKHVAVLERARLVTKEKHGREQLVRANPAGLVLARRLLAEYDAITRQHADRTTTLPMEDEERS